MKILLTNDDGYKALGIRALADILSPFGEIRVVAPEEHQSGMSMAVSLSEKNLLYTSAGGCWGYLNGTPATCVKFAVDKSGMGMIPDIVVSGINHGSNAATAACYSGTLGACEEAALNGVKAIGVSVDAMIPEPDFSGVAEYFPKIFNWLMDNYSERHGTYYNVNFPAIPASEIKGVRFGHMGLGFWDLEFIGNPDGSCHMKGTFVENASNDGSSDHRLLAGGYISITPHNLDNTDYAELERLEKKGFRL